MKKVLHLVILLAMLCMSLSYAVPAGADAPPTINVPAQYLTIQQAIDNATAGATIIVAAGTYTEDLSIVGKNGLQLVGASGAIIKGITTTVKGTGGMFNIKVWSNGVKIHGFTILSPDAVAGSWSSGMIIDGTNVEIYNNTFEVANNLDGDTAFSVGIQTNNIADASNIPSGIVDVSGLYIHDNAFSLLDADNGTANSGYEAIYINPDNKTGAATIDNNVFSSFVARGITTERSNLTISNNNFITDVAPTLASSRAIRVGTSGGEAQNAIAITGNTVAGSGAGKGFASGIKIGVGGQTLTNVNITGNTVQLNDTGISILSAAGGMTVTSNNISGNLTFGLSNTDTAILDAENNWWGSITGPTDATGNPNGTGDAVSGEVDYTPWLNVTATPASNIAGLTTNYPVSFTATTAGNIKTIGITFPDGFDVSGATKGAVSGIQPGAISVSGQTVTYTVNTDSPALVVAGTTISITLNGIVNPVAANDTNALTVTTSNTAGTVIDTSPSLPDFAIVAATLFVAETQPDAAVNDILAEIQVTATYNSNPVAGLPITVSVGVQPVGGTLIPTISGTLTQITNEYGIATFDNLSLSLEGNWALYFNGGGAEQVSSNILVYQTETWTVGNGGDYDYSGIQEAIDAETTHDGDTIQVNAGIYDEFVNIDKDLTVTGIGFPAIVPVTAITAATPTPTAPDAVVTISSGGVTLEGIAAVISGYVANTAPTYGIKISASPGPPITVQNNSVAADNITSTYGIAAYGYSGTVNIRGNTVDIGQPLVRSEVTVGTAPELVSAEISNLDRDTLVLTYSLALDTSCVPANIDFTIGGAELGVNYVAISGDTVTLTLSGDINDGEEITLTYTPGDYPIQSAADGTDAAALVYEEVVITYYVINGYGIYVEDCDVVKIGSYGAGNTLNIFAVGEYASGIEVSDCDSVWVNYNNITANATVDTGNDASAAGIYIESDYYSNSDQVQVNNNIVYTEAISDYGAYAWPITVYDFNNAEVIGNTVRATADGTYYSVIESIDVQYGDNVIIQNNTIGSSEVSANSTSGYYSYADGIYTDEIDESQDISENELYLNINATLETLLVGPGSVDSQAKDQKQHAAGHSAPGIEVNWDYVYAEGYGIYVNDSNGSINISENTVVSDVTAEVGEDIEFMPAFDDGETIKYAYGEAYTEGITLDDCYGDTSITGNSVEVDAAMIAVGQYEDGWPRSAGTGYAEAYGLYLDSVNDESSYSTLVEGNSFEAEADGLGAAFTDYVYQEQESDYALYSAAMNIIDAAKHVSNGAVDGILNVSAGSTTEISSVRSEGDISVVAAGIYGEYTKGLEIVNNELISGNADGEIISIALNEVVEDANARAGGSAWVAGAGIVLVDGPASLVNNNTVEGYGDAYAMVVAAEGDVSMDTVFSNADTRALSIGILNICSFFIYGTEQQTSIDSTFSDNIIEAEGSSAIEVIAGELIPEECAVAIGRSFNLAVGVASLVPANDTISGNTITTEGDCFVGSMSVGNSSEDPYAQGSGRGYAIGIYTQTGSPSDGYGSYVLNNTVDANSDTYAYVEAFDPIWLMDTNSKSYSTSFAAGLLTATEGQTIEGNTLYADSNTEVEVYSGTDITLDEAYAEGFARSIASGLVLYNGEEFSGGNSTVTHNNIDANSNAYVDVVAEGTFSAEDGGGFSIAADVLTLETEADINYNNIGEGAEPSSTQSSENVIEVDLGMAPIYSFVDARYNWWSDVTGPSSYITDPACGNLSEDVSGECFSNIPPTGFGKALRVIDFDGSYMTAQYDWWLSHPFEDIDADHAGYYGFGIPLVEGWNTLSAPMSLEQPVFTNAAGTGIADISGLTDPDNPIASIAYYYDPTQANPWIQVTNGYNLNPLNGLYVKMNAPGTVFMASNPQQTAPQRSLTQGQNWYLIGPTPYDEDFPFTREMSPQEALVSLELTPAGLVGYDQVVSPYMANQEPWFLTRANIMSAQYGEYMEWGKAYWIFMENPDTLAGFIFTPLPMDLTQNQEPY